MNDKLDVVSTMVRNDGEERLEVRIDNGEDNCILMSHLTAGTKT